MGPDISAADANRNFSKLLGEVRAGRSCVITSHGKPVARLVPMKVTDRSRASAQSALLSRLSAQSTKGAKGAIGRWTRDELYEKA